MSTSRGRAPIVSAGFIVGFLGAAMVRPAVLHAQAAPPGRVFASDAGMVLNFIKPDKAAAFEKVVSRVRDALHKSDKPGRQQQARGWKVFRAVEPGANGSILYLFVLDPVAKGEDYTVSTILAEAFPTEVQQLYKEFAESYAQGQNVVNLNVAATLDH
jgi:hypothetical protein